MSSHPKGKTVEHFWAVWQRPQKPTVAQLVEQRTGVVQQRILRLLIRILQVGLVFLLSVRIYKM